MYVAICFYVKAHALLHVQALTHVHVHVCKSACHVMYMPTKRSSGSSKIVENASNAAVELWLSALSPGWRLLAALLSQFSHNHPE